jgi:2-polyprenyl-6-methoxyphenol hydroxylase-like FAD-dependent oxidoreductase
MKTVLISGASVAGLTLAHWLRRRGYAPTVVERAPALRPGGQALDVRGVALDVIDRMGLLAEARAARTRMGGMTMLDGDGKEVWRSTEMTLSSGRLDSDDIELLRDDLTELLYGRTREGVEYLFGDSIATLDDEGDGEGDGDERTSGVRVSFERAPARTFDLVIGADGLRSKVRQLAFGDEGCDDGRYIRTLGPHVAVFSTDNFVNLDNWQVWLDDGTATYCLYPVRDNSEIRATLGFRSEPPAYDHRDIEQQKALVAGGLGHLGGDTPQLLKGMWAASDFYFDAVAQVRMDHWSRGRCALVGDAGYSPSLLSGQGTSVALVGAYVLADELGKVLDGGEEGVGGGHRSAFARYEERLRPFVELNQALAIENSGSRAAEESIERAKNAISLDS